jgi:mRNA interferase RelE/StbE
VNYKLRIDPAAARQLQRLDPQYRQDVVQRISALAEDPRPQGCKLLLDSKARGWRVRVGNAAYCI